MQTILGAGVLPGKTLRKFMREMPEMMYQYDRDYFFDSSKFMKAFDFKVTPYETGIKETVQAG